MYTKCFKRTIDILVSIISMILLSPLFLFIAVCIKAESKGPVIFRQKRIGKNGKIFEILKFRSMCEGAEGKGSGVYSGKGDPRVTKVGKALRAASIDELPQLLNVLRGDMSLIGFRPPLTYHPWPYAEYTDDQKKMFRVRPGITGWAQVHGRKNVEWNRRIDLNVWYVEHLSFSWDFRIICMTFSKVFTNSDNVNTYETANREKPSVGAGKEG